MNTPIHTQLLPAVFKNIVSNTKYGNKYKHIYLNFLFFTSEDVDFCGYTVPHPAEAKMLFRIQTKETPALDVLKRGLKDLEKVCDHTIDLFEKEVKEFNKGYNLFYLMCTYLTFQITE